MLWILVALSSHLSWAFGNVGEKYIISNKIKNPYVYQLWSILLGITCLILIPFISFEIPNIHQLPIVILASVFYFCSGFPYVKAMQEEEVTRINIWWFLIPVFSLVMSWMILGEFLNGQQIIAFLILITASILASLRIGLSKIKFSKAFWLMVLSCLFFAAQATANRYLTAFAGMNYLNVFVWTNILMFVFAVMLFGIKKVRKSSAEESKTVDWKLFAGIFALYLLNHLGNLFNLLAVSLAPTALVFAMEGFQAIFVFIIVVILSLFTAASLKEELDLKNVLLKVLTLILGVVGILVLNL
jgi:drug/metabolite transporter (DMT)-like permease